MKKHDLLIKI